MKDKSNIILGIVLLVVVVFCFFATSGISNSGKSNGELTAQEVIELAQRESAEVKDDERKKMDSIDLDEYMDIYKDDEKSIVFLGSSSCGYCKVSQPIVENVAFEHDLDIYYLNAGEFSEKEKEKFIDSNELFSEGYGTPMILIVSDGEILSYLDGLTYHDDYVKFFKENKFIKE